MADLKSSVAEVKLAYDLVDYVQGSGVRLQQKGNVFKGLCPFHNERTPSFQISPEFQNYKCFGCGAQGDLLSFVQAYEHLEFFDALKKLAEDKNIVLDVKEERSGVDYSSLREAMKAASNFYLQEYRKLPPEHPAREEVRKRGLSEKKMLYGYAPEGRTSLYKHLKEKGFTDETILLTGACTRWEDKPSVFDFWSGRLMFFFTDITGKPLGWSGRKLYETDKRGKYVNSKDGVLFDKSAVLFNLANAKKMAAETKKVYVNEGQFDVASLVEAGLSNSVAASGTAFTEKQGLILRRLVGEDGQIIFCFDGDKAGRAAAEKVFTRIPSLHSQSYVVMLPEGHDPDTYRQEHGPEALVSYLDSNPIPLVEFVLSLASESFNLQDEMDKSKYLQKAASILRTVTSSILRETYTKRVSLDSFTSIEVVRQAITVAKPLVSDAPPANAEAAPAEEELVEEASVEGEEPEFTAVTLRRMVLEDEAYELSARLIALVFTDRNLTGTLRELQAELPQELRSLVDELVAYPAESPLIPEKFTSTELVGELMLNNYFPFAHLMGSEEKADQARHLAHRLTRLRQARSERRVRSRVASVLQKSPSQGAEFLEKALEQEAKGLEALQARDSSSDGS